MYPLAAANYRGILALLRAEQGAFEEARELLAVGERQVVGMSAHRLGLLLCKKARVEHLGQRDPRCRALVVIHPQPRRLPQQQVEIAIVVSVGQAQRLRVNWCTRGSLLPRQ